MSASWCSLRLSVVLCCTGVVLLLGPSPAYGRGFVHWCKLEEPTRLVFQDPADGLYYFVDDESVQTVFGHDDSNDTTTLPVVEDTTNNNNNRWLAKGTGMQQRVSYQGTPSVPVVMDPIRPVGTRRLSDQYTNVFSFQECVCGNSFAGFWSDAWCPVPATSFCALPNPRHDDGYLGCVDRANGERGWLRICLLACLCLFTIVFACLCFTEYGHMTIDLVLNQCFCWKWTPYVARRMLEKDPDRARALIRHHIRLRREFLRRRYRHLTGQDIPTQPSPEELIPTTHRRKPTSLALKTCIYQSPEDGNEIHQKRKGQTNALDDTEEGTFCTICFMPLETGDRVGNLECGHTFHVDCLKDWLARRNVCPLCQKEDVAQPRYEDKPTVASLP